MAVTGTYTARQIVRAALRKIGVIAKDTEATAAEMEDALFDLNVMLKSWQNEGYNLFNYASQQVTLTTAASYDLDPVRPLRILSCRFKRNGIELPMQQLTRNEYDTLPKKDTTGTPTTFYYDKQREAAKLYVWPVLASASSETLQITYEQEYEDMTDLDSVVPIPGEWWEACVYSLAGRVADGLQISGPDVDRVIARGELLIRNALAADREGSVYFGEAWGGDAYH